MSIKRKLGCGSLGNGIVVWDSLNQEAGDYQRIAHINRHRQINWCVDLQDLAPEYQNQVKSWAHGPNFAASTSQPDMKVFSE
ncbi:MAG: hypothetical protein ACR2PT_23680 [Endozoicomonas sp.]